jgi:hypothetical protein
MLGLLEELLDNGPMWVFAPLGSLLLFPLLIEAKKLIDRISLPTSAAIAGLIAIAGWAAAAAAPAYSADREQRFVIEQVTDGDHGRSWWSILNDGASLPSAFGKGWTTGKLPFSERKRWLASAPADAGAKAPAVQLLSQLRAGDERTVTVRLAANGNENIVLLAPDDAKIRSAGSAGFVRPIDPNLDGKYSISCSGRSCDGATLQMTIDQREPVQFLIVGSKGILPPSAAALLSARPNFARPQYNRDESITFAHIKL